MASPPPATESGGETKCSSYADDASFSGLDNSSLASQPAALFSPNELSAPEVSVENKGYGLAYSSASISCTADPKAHLCLFQIYDMDAPEHYYPRSDGQEQWYSMLSPVREVPQISELEGKKTAFRVKQCISLEYTKEAAKGSTLTGEDVLLYRRDPEQGLAVRVQTRETLSGLAKRISTTYPHPQYFICNGSQDNPKLGDKAERFSMPTFCHADPALCEGIRTQIQQVLEADTMACPRLLREIQSTAAAAYEKCHRFSLAENSKKSTDDQWCELIGTMANVGQQLPSADIERYFCLSFSSRQEIRATINQINEEAKKSSSALKLAEQSSGVGCSSGGASGGSYEEPEPYNSGTDDTSGFILNADPDPDSSGSAQQQQSGGTGQQGDTKTAQQGTDSQGKSGSYSYTASDEGAVSDEQSRSGGGGSSLTPAKMLLYGLGSVSILYGLKEAGVLSWAQEKGKDGFSWLRSRFSTEEKALREYRSALNDLALTESDSVDYDKKRIAFDEKLENLAKARARKDLKDRSANPDAEAIQTKKNELLKDTNLSDADGDGSRPVSADTDLPEGTPRSDVLVEARKMPVGEADLKALKKNAGISDTGKTVSFNSKSVLVPIAAGAVAILIGKGLELYASDSVRAVFSSFDQALDSYAERYSQITAISDEADDAILNLLQSAKKGK
ncbi:MAG: hypothetical protein H6618_01510 [Deltaproteobacteria bacterium]|nr:hypothetical protein [Deltaproteobacteria bacterium]